MSKKEKTEHQKDLYESLRRLDTGEGVYVIAGTPREDGEIKANFYYSNNFPDIEIDTITGKRKLEVSFSSNAQDNEQLLHQLFSKTRKFSNK